MYDALDIAKYIINYCNHKGYPISNLRLQKLLYFIQAQFISHKGIICFGEEMHCWDYGPAVPKVYQEFRKNGSNSIPSSYEQKFYDRDCETKELNMKFYNQYDRYLVESVIEAAHSKPLAELIKISLQQSPWKENYQHDKIRLLPLESMYEYFRNQSFSASTRISEDYPTSIGGERNHLKQNERQWRAERNRYPPLT